MHGLEKKINERKLYYTSRYVVIIIKYCISMINQKYIINIMKKIWSFFDSRLHFTVRVYTNLYNLTLPKTNTYASKTIDHQPYYCYVKIIMIKGTQN